MERQIRKRQGLFIKKDADLLKTVSLKDFSFDDLCEHNLLFHDNPNANLIHRKYHEEVDLDHAIKPHAGLQKEIRDQDSIPPILQPIDFTGDWRRQQARASKRARGKIEDEDEFELELEIARRKEEEALAAREAAQRREENAANKQKGLTAEAPKTRASDAPDTDLAGIHEVETSADLQSDVAIDTALQSPDEIVAEIRRDSDLQADQETSENERPKDGFAEQRANLDTIGEAIKHIGDHPEEDAEPSASSPSGRDQDDFIPVSSEANDNPEQVAMEEYEAKQVKKEEKYQRLFEEAKNQGFEAGFKEGEAKGVAQLQDLTKRVTENVSDMLTELATLKRSILESAEENFMQVCQALGETLLQHEFSVNPESFAHVIRKAIGDSMPDDKFKVKVHPAFLEHLKKTDLGELSGKLVADDQVDLGSFKIESELSSIEGDIRQVIADLLEAGQSEIFRKDDKEVG